MFHAERTVWYGQDLSHANMQASRFKHSDMRNCNFDLAYLRGSNFSKKAPGGFEIMQCPFLTVASYQTASPAQNRLFRS